MNIIGLSLANFKQGLLLICFAALVFIPAQAHAEKRLPLTQVVRKTMETYFSAASEEKPSFKQLAGVFSVPPPYRKPAGVFVTLSRGGKSRACWGSVFPQQADVVKSTVYATLGALTKEYRYRPIQPGEWRTLTTQVTVVKDIESMTSLAHLNPLKDGLMIRSGTRSGVILPGEARDATYQLVQARLKAGIQPGESYQLYRIKADVYL